MRKIADFMLRIDQYENADLHELNKSAVHNLQSLSGSSQLYWIEKQDKVTASVNHSIPVPAPISMLDPAFFKMLPGNEPLYFSENPLPELQVIAGTAKRMVILPLTDNSPESCVLLLWNEVIEFTESFREFIYVAFSVMRRVAKVSSVFSSVAQLEVHFNAILQTVPQSVIFIDASGKKSWVNENASNLLNLPSGIVEPAALATAMHLFRSRADNHQEIYERGMEFFNSNQKEVSEWKWIFSDPELLVLNVYCTPTNSSTVNGVLWMFENITEEYLADQKIQELNIKLQKASDYKSEFLANMSHELRTPLNSILVLATLLGENEPGNLTQRQIRDAEIIKNSGDDLLYLINDILDLSKIEAGKMDLHYETESVFAIAQTMKDLFTVVSDSRNIEFQLEIMANVPEIIYTDRHRLNQVIKNLLSNAFKFTPSGGKVKLLFDTDASQKLLKISVRDTGIGVEEDKKLEIFEAFKQANGTTSRNYGGTGLGLSISKELVWKFGGHIYIESTIGEGSLFLVEIPLAEKEKFKKNPAQDAMTWPNNAEDEKEQFPDLINKTVLLVSDDIREIFTLNTVLENQGLSVTHAFSSEEFLSLVKRAVNPDLILLDLSMENNSGSELMNHLLVSPLNAIPLLTIAPLSLQGNADPDVSVEEILYKPVNQVQLLSKIQKLLVV